MNAERHSGFLGAWPAALDPRAITDDSPPTLSNSDSDVRSAESASKTRGIIVRKNPRM